MGKIILIAVFFLSVLNLVGSETIDAQISKVNLFSNYVEFHQNVKPYLSKGRNVVIVYNVPLRIVEQTLNVSTKGKGFITAFNHKSIKASDGQLKSRLEGIEDSLQVFRNQLLHLKSDIEVYTEEKLLITENRTRIGTDSGLDGIDLQEAADFYRKRLTQINDQLIQLNRGADEFKKAIDLLEKAYKKIIFSDRRIGALEVVVESPINQYLEIDIQYLSYDGGWKPCYTLDYSSRKEDLEMNYNAKVWNNTGISWNNVWIGLSTGVPKMKLSLPELKEQNLDWYEPFDLIARGSRSTNTSENLFLDDTDVEATLSNQRLDYKAESILHTVNDYSGLWITFNVQQRQSIPSDQMEYIIPIGSHQLEASYYYLCVPKLDQEAYLVASVNNWEGLNLLKGIANVYSDGKYVGSIQIDPSLLEESLEVPLGTDARVVIEKKLNLEKSNIKTLGSSKKKEQFYDLTVRSNKKDSILLKVKDQIPVTRLNDIEIDIENISKGQLEESTGKVVWEFYLGMGQSRSFVIHYLVKYPKSRRINL